MKARRASVIRWTSDSDLLPHIKAIKKATRKLHLALMDLGEELEYQGYTAKQIQERLRKEFFKVAHQVLDEER